MRKITCLLLVLALSLSVSAWATERGLTTAATGYTAAGDVEYVTVSGTVVNWGARGEEATFLTLYAESYYTGDYSWDVLSALSGGTGVSDAPGGELYEALQDMMVARHTNIQGYQDTRPYYQYTDCVGGDYSQISSFYSGKTVNGTWDGKTYNREHIWPKSKCINQSKKEDSADIMMLRPTISSENSARGNKAYGEGSGYYDPGADVRGDCARMVLYGYVRWGNTSYMWGASGVMESLDILLKWMEEDPVDTWEMGRNDAVESITGVRNVFVDYPEYAWLLFGQEIPEDMVTPSGEAAETAPVCTHQQTQIRDSAEATCGADGYSGDTYCLDCGEQIASGEVLPATGEHEMASHFSDPRKNRCRVCGYEEYVEMHPCKHENTELRDKKEALCAEDGYTGDTYCLDCGYLLKNGEAIPSTGEHTLDEAGHCTDCDYFACTHINVEHRNQRDATCGSEGHTGDVYCADCGEFIAGGSVIPATGEHTLDDVGHCTGCPYTDEHQSDDISISFWVLIGLGVAAVAVVIIVIVKKKR